jgi:phosphoglycerate dehydrogenase-like enzyme
MSTTEPLLVQIAYPDIEKLVDVTRVPAIDPRIEMVVTSYVENMELRTAKRLGPDAPGLAEMAPPLDDDYRDALARAEVMFCLDAPLNLPALAPNLRWIQAVGSGVGQFAASRLEDGDITLTNAAGVGAPSIAEFVIGMIVAAWKDFPALAELQRARKWESHYGRLIMGSTVGVIGLGAIGAAVAQRVKPFGVEVLAIRRSFEPGMTAPNVDELFGPDALHEVLARSDTVVLAAAGTPETENLIGEAELAAMRPGSVFVNVARGTMVDEPALIAALESGHLRAAAIDVAREEPMPPDAALWDAPNLIFSPHSSPSQDRYFDMVFDLFIDNLGRYVAGESLRNVIDLSKGY